MLILHQINRSMLLLHSPTDEVHESVFMPFFKNILKVKWVEFYESSHLVHFEEPERSVSSKNLHWEEELMTNEIETDTSKLSVTSYCINSSGAELRCITCAGCLSR